MTNKMHLTSQVTAMALLPGAKPVLSDDLKRLRLVLVCMTQAMQSVLKQELGDALSPVNATLEKVKSYY